MATPSQQDIDNAKALFNCRSNGLQEKEITFAQGQVLSGLSLLDNQQVDQALDFFSCRANGAQQKEISFYIGVLLANLDISSGSGITQLTGDVTAGPGSGSVVATLAAVRVGGDVTSDAGSVVVSTGSGNNAMATGVTIDGSGNVAGVASLQIVASKPAVGLLMLQNTSSIGYSSFDLLDSTGAVRSGFGYANSSSGGVFQNKAYLYTSGGNGIAFSNDGGSTLSFLVDSGGGHFAVTDSSTNTIVTALTMTRTTSATAQPGLGVAQVFQLPSDAGTLRSAAQFNSVWVGTPTDGAENSELDFYTFNNGIQFLAMSIGPGGGITFNGAITTGVWNGNRIGIAYGGVNIDTGWTANASGGSKTVAVQNFAASGFTGTMATALDTVSAGTGTFFAAQAQQVQDLTNKLQALEATLVLSTMPNA